MTAGVDVLVITTPSCHHCRAMQPELDRLERVHGASMRIERIDATTQPERVAMLGVQAAPTVIMRAAGVERARLVGRVSDRDLAKFFATAGAHRPFPLDGVARAAAGVALIGLGFVLGAVALVAVGLAVSTWGAATLWKWSR